MAREKETRYVMQDGRDFYIYRDSAMTDLQQTWTAPIRVGLDFAKAVTARTMCENQLKLAGYDIEWPSPFAESN